MRHTRTLLFVSSTLLGSALAAQQQSERFLPVAVSVMSNGVSAEHGAEALI